jgi:hypothetical protein
MTMITLIKIKIINIDIITATTIKIAITPATIVYIN